MPLVEVDQNAREILRAWKQAFGVSRGAAMDYSEAIRAAAGSMSVPAAGAVIESKKKKRR